MGSGERHAGYGHLRAAQRRAYRLLGRVQSALEVGCRRQDVDAAERVQRQQVLVSGDDDLSLAVDRQFQELVVLRVAAGAYVLDDFNDLDTRRQPIEQSFTPRRDT